MGSGPEDGPLLPWFEPGVLLPEGEVWVSDCEGEDVGVDFGGGGEGDGGEEAQELEGEDDGAQHRDAACPFALKESRAFVIPTRVLALKVLLSLLSLVSVAVPQRQQQEWRLSTMPWKLRGNRRSQLLHHLHQDFQPSGQRPKPVHKD